MKLKRIRCDRCASELFGITGLKWSEITTEIKLKVQFTFKEVGSAIRLTMLYIQSERERTKNYMYPHWWLPKEARHEHRLRLHRMPEIHLYSRSSVKSGRITEFQQQQKVIFHHFSALLLSFEPIYLVANQSCFFFFLFFFLPFVFFCANVSK